MKSYILLTLFAFAANDLQHKARTDKYREYFTVCASVAEKIIADIINKYRLHDEKGNYTY